MNKRNFLLLALLCIAFSGITAAKTLSFFSGGTFKSGFALDGIWPDNTTVCVIDSDDWILSVTDNTVNWGGCGAVNAKGSLDLTGYNIMEIDVNVNNPPTDHDILIKIEIQDTKGVKGGVQVALLPQQVTLRFPLANFDTADLSKVNGVIINLFNLMESQGAVISAIRFVDSGKFPVFDDDVSIANQPVNGPVVIFSWPDGAPACDPFFALDSAPEGDHVLNVGNGTWGCGFFNFPFNFASTTAIRFSLNSKVPVLIEFTDNGGNKFGLPNIPSTNGTWQRFTFTSATLSGLGLDLRTVNYEFMITKVGSADNNVYVDNIRYSY